MYDLFDIRSCNINSCTYQANYLHVKYVPKGNGDPERRAELDLAEKGSLRKRSKELESDLCRVEELRKQISLFENILLEKDKTTANQREIINQLNNEHQLKYNKGILPGLESPLSFVLEKYLNSDVSSIKKEMEESKAEIQGKVGSKGDQNGHGRSDQVQKDQLPGNDLQRHFNIIKFIFVLLSNFSLPIEP